MDNMGNWTQFSALLGSLFAGLYAFYHITEKRLDRLEARHKEELMQWRREHKEDIKEIHKEAKAMNAKWESLFKLFVELKLKNDK